MKRVFSAPLSSAATVAVGADEDDDDDDADAHDTALAFALCNDDAFGASRDPRPADAADGAPREAAERVTPPVVFTCDARRRTRISSFRAAVPTAVVVILQRCRSHAAPSPPSPSSPSSRLLLRCLPTFVFSFSHSSSSASPSSSSSSSSFLLLSLYFLAFTHFSHLLLPPPSCPPPPPLPPLAGLLVRVDAPPPSLLASTLILSHTHLPLSPSFENKFSHTLTCVLYNYARTSKLISSPFLARFLSLSLSLSLFCWILSKSFLWCLILSKSFALWCWILSKSSLSFAGF